jgi:hypothetical protein
MSYNQIPEHYMPLHGNTIFPNWPYIGWPYSPGAYPMFHYKDPYNRAAGCYYNPATNSTVCPNYSSFYV